MKAHYIVRQKEKDKPVIRRQIRICVNCGSTKVKEYNIGICCLRCGTCFYFGKIYW